jgi:DNA-directed RNA polymerase subunit RPC12/RpoP
MSSDSSGPKAQALKCTECGAKISAEDVQPGEPIVCSYCGALILLSRPNAPPAAGGLGPRPGMARPGLRFAGRRPAWGAGRPEHAPLFHAVKLLVDKGAIDGKTLREYTKRNLDGRMQPPMALRTALVQMKNDGKLNRDKMLRATDELVAEQKVLPRAREIVDRLFSQ